MRSGKIFDAIGGINDKYIISAWNRINGGRKINKGNGIYEKRGFLYSAAALVLALASFFGVAMAVNADFREAVFRFFHISTADVLPGEDEAGKPGSLGDIEIIGSEKIEEAAEITHLRVNGNVDWSDGVIWVASYEEETAGQILGVYALEDGQLKSLEPHQEKLEYIWGEDLYQISFEWYDNNGRVCTRARDYDMETCTDWQVLAADGKSDVCIINLGKGAQIDYTRRTLLYNLKTKEITDVLAGCDALDSQLINEIKFSPDLSKALITCNLGRGRYYYDIAGNVLKPLSELAGEETAGAWFVDEEAIACTFENEDGTFDCRAYMISSGEPVEVFKGLTEKKRDTDFGFMFTGGRHGLYVDEEYNVYVYDLRTGERALVEGFRYPSGKTFTSVNGSGDKILFSSSDSDTPGLGIAQIGILDLEKQSFTLLDREGYEARREGIMSWFDNDRVVIRASADPDRLDSGLYLYVYAIY